jgi:hypothetical protein
LGQRKNPPVRAGFDFFIASTATRLISHRPDAPKTATKADSEIFNKFGRSMTSGRCTMGDDDFVSDGFLELVAACLVVLCSSLLAIAFMQ